MRFAAAFLLFHLLASAEERTVQLVNLPTDRGYQEMATVLRSVTDVSKVSLDSKQRSLSLEASPANLNAAEWLAHQLDKPSGWQPSSQEKGNPAAREYHLAPGHEAGILRIFYLSEGIPDPALQDSLVALRSVLDISKAFSYSPLHLLAFRGTEAEVNASEWLIHAIDGRSASEPYTFAEGIPPGIVRVFPLPSGVDFERARQLMAQLRNRPIGLRVYGRRDIPNIAVRGTAAQLELAEKVVSSFQ